MVTNHGTDWAQLAHLDQRITTKPNHHTCVCVLVAVSNRCSLEQSVNVTHT